MGKNRKSLRSEEHIKLCELLVSARKGADLTQDQVATELGWPQSDISKVETGERRLDVIEFVQLCKVLGVDSGALIKKLN